MKVNDITFRYENKIVFEDFSLEIPDGIVCLMGPSGEGKTTLLKLLGGLLVPEKGQIDTPYRKPAFMFQEDRLLPWLNVGENIALVSKIEREAWELLAELGLQPDMKIDELSGGMARRVALVRTLMYDGDILLLDEPFKGFDKKLMEKTAEIIIRQKKPAIISTHSLDEVKLLSAEIIEL
ncbi:MAG: ATP-binding cassette domain-containing protein [Erysipelotrichaceae bacterium]|nr:ATP-binding cassette domain-containing protein [Erysipelotrichaceae bacterium]